MQEWGLSIPKIHELDKLLEMLLPRDSTLGKLGGRLDWLTQCAVDYRYPGFHADARKTRSAMKIAERIRVEVRTRLGLRTKR